MWRSLQWLLYGLLTSTLLTSAISVYVFHDVDRDQTGHLNAAFLGLCQESALFSLLIGAGVSLLLALAQFLFRARVAAGRPKLIFLLGVAIPLLQYPWDFLVRSFAPRFAQQALYAYLIAAILFSTVVLLWQREARADRRIV